MTLNNNLLTYLEVRMKRFQAIKRKCTIEYYSLLLIRQYTWLHLSKEFRY